MRKSGVLAMGFCIILSACKDDDPPDSAADVSADPSRAGDSSETLDGSAVQTEAGTLEAGLVDGSVGDGGLSDGGVDEGGVGEGGLDDGGWGEGGVPIPNNDGGDGPIGPIGPGPDPDPTGS